MKRYSSAVPYLIAALMVQSCLSDRCDEIYSSIYAGDSLWIESSHYEKDTLVDTVMGTVVIPEYSGGGINITSSDGMLEKTDSTGRCKLFGSKTSLFNLVLGHDINVNVYFVKSPAELLTFGVLSELGDTLEINVAVSIAQSAAHAFNLMDTTKVKFHDSLIYYDYQISDVYEYELKNDKNPDSGVVPVVNRMLISQSEGIIELTLVDGRSWIKKKFIQHE
ncbi:MAG: hypothetical protein RL204_485 [Bacteroidota bacterium]|jgi:hypothetical protein